MIKFDNICALCTECPFDESETYNNIFYEIHITVEYDKKFIKS